jgi:hypothetical protein
MRTEKRSRFVVSHISRKTSEIWGTPRFVEGRKTGGVTCRFPPTLLSGNLRGGASLRRVSGALRRIVLFVVDSSV